MGVLFRTTFVLFIFLMVSNIALAQPIRVKVEEGQSIEIEPKSDAKVYNSNDELVITLKANHTAYVRYSSSVNAVIEGKTVRLPMKIVPEASVYQPEGYIYIGDRKYKGYAQIAAKNGKLYGINIVDIEDYLKGVIAGEMPSGWDMEALKSQAVAARTYAYFGLSQPRSSLYDICDSVSCQVYKGVSGEHSDTNIAVDETRGKILTYNDNVIQAFFHDTSGGGLTESGYVFVNKEVPYLQPVKDYDDSSPYRSWSRSITVADLLSRLAPHGVHLSKLAKIRIEYNNSNRVKRVIISDGEKSYTVSGMKFRSLMSLKSNSFSVSINDGIVTITGSGNGHGIGLSQWGARGMAKLGFKYEEILSHYYPGTLLVSYEQE